MNQYNLDFLYLLLQKLGFEDDNLKKNYLRYLLESNVVKTDKHLGSPEDGKVYYYGNIVTELVDEIILKKLDNLIEKDVSPNFYITATDISNFSFCSTYFAINRTFKDFQSTSKLVIEEGVKLHENTLLHFKKDNTKCRRRGKTEFTLSEDVITKLNKIKNCKSLYVGHTIQSEIFQNKEFNFFGQPDYIFETPSGDRFVVEEKFSKRNKDPFENQKLQVASYVKFIEKYEIKFGILINWLYDFDDNGQYIKDVTITNIHLENFSDKLEEVYNDVKKFTQSGSLEFDRKSLISKKCVNCSLRNYCGHKTGQFKVLKYPYSKEYLKLSDKINTEKVLSKVPLNEIKGFFGWSNEPLSIK